MPKKNQVKVDVIVDDKGSMKKSAIGAHSVDRRLKGAAKASSGASKNFSKMAQGISGGLVPAYATLAASLFALDAVYRALSSAADLRILKEGQIAYAKATGQAMNAVAGAVQRATQFQVSFREASQAAAIAASAGFGTSQIVALGKAANDAAKVLGRSVPDAFDRLIRGVVKAEPEVLDELGIILRLEDASEAYALQMGLTASELTVFEKQQAVLNDVLDQAERKFARVAASIDPNPWTQLGVALEKVKDTLAVFLSSYLEPVATFLAGNAKAAIIAMGVFIASIMRGLIPSYAEQSQAFIASQEAQQIEIDQTIAKLQELKAQKAGGVERMGMAEGGAMATVQGSSTKFDKRTSLGRLQSGKTISARAAQQELDRYKAGTSQMIKMSAHRQKALVRDLRIIAREGKFTGNKITVSFKKAYFSIQSGLHRTVRLWKIGMRTIQKFTTVAARAMSLAMSAMGWIGMITLIVQYIRDWKEKANELTGAEKKLQETTENLTKTYTDLGVTFEAMIPDMDEIRDSWTTHSQQVDFYSNALKNIPTVDTLKHLKALKTDTIPKELRDTLEDVFTKVKQIVPSVKELNANMSKEQIIEYVEQFQRFSLAMQEINSYYKMATEAETKYKKAQKARIDGLIKSEFKKEIRELVTLTRAYKGVTMDLEGVKKVYSTEERAKLESYAKQLTRLLEIRKEEIQAQEAALRIGHKQSRLYKFQAEEARRLTLQIEKSVKAVQLASKIKVAQTALEAFVDPAGKVKTGSEWEHAEAKVQIARLKFEKAIHDARMEYLEKMKVFINRITETMMESMASGMQKGLESMLTGESSLREAARQMAQTIQAAMAKEMAATWTDKFMALLPKTEAQKLEEATETALVQAEQDMWTATKALADVVPNLQENVETALTPAINLLRDAILYNTDALHFNTQGLGGKLSPDELARINRLEDPDKIYAGQEIMLPDKSMYKVKGEQVVGGTGAYVKIPRDTLTSILDRYYGGHIQGTAPYIKVTEQEAAAKPSAVQQAIRDSGGSGFSGIGIGENGKTTSDDEVIETVKEVLELTYEQAYAQALKESVEKYPVVGMIEGAKYGEQQMDEAEDFMVTRMKELGHEMETLENKTKEASSGFKDFLMKLIPPSGGWLGIGAFGLASGGRITKSGKVQYFAGGGMAKGKDTVPAMLSPGEYVLTPGQMRSMGQGSTVVNVNMTEGGGTTTSVRSDRTEAAKFGRAIASAVNHEIMKQKRAGGKLWMPGLGNI